MSNFQINMAFIFAVAVVLGWLRDGPVGSFILVAWVFVGMLIGIVFYVFGKLAKKMARW